MNAELSPALADVWMERLLPTGGAAVGAGSRIASQRQQLDAFLQSVERRALYMLELGTRQREEALDLLQDCMLRFVRRYSSHPAADWPPLFFRVVNNALVDWQRRRSVRDRVLALWPWSRAGNTLDEDAVELDPAGPEAAQPQQVGERDNLLVALNRALAELPTRQRQTFLLREWQGLSVAEAAQALGVSEGSVKTHLSRAQARLREVLSEHR